MSTDKTLSSSAKRLSIIGLGAIAFVAAAFLSGCNKKDSAPAATDASKPTVSQEVKADVKKAAEDTKDAVEDAAKKVESEAKKAADAVSK